MCLCQPLVEAEAYRLCTDVPGASPKRYRRDVEPLVDAAIEKYKIEMNPDDPHSRRICSKMASTTTCAAASVRANRDGAVVTRHGLTKFYAVTRSLRPAPQRAPVVHDRAISDRPLANEASAPPISPDILRFRSSPDASKAPLSHTPPHA